MPIRPLRSALLAATIGAVLAACAGSPSPTASSTATAMPTPPTTGTEAPSTSATSSPSSPPESPDATGGGETPFTCDLPIVDPGTVSLANVVDVRVGSHGGHDRFVLEFEQGTPPFSLERAEPPFVQDGSGQPVEVEGSSFLGLVMPGGTKQTDAGTSSYSGPTDFDAGFPQLVHAVEIGDFERQSTWVLGLADEACVRVLVLDDPPRLVVDVEH